MKSLRMLCPGALAAAIATAGSENDKKLHAITMADLPGWQHIVITALWNDGQWFTYKTGNGIQVRNLRTGQETDQNVLNAPTTVIGLTRSGGSVLISDGWDIWNIPAHGGAATNLTGNGRKDHLRCHRRFRLDPDEREKGIDLCLNDRMKQFGISRIDNGQPGAKMLLMEDTFFGEEYKAKDT